MADLGAVGFLSVPPDVHVRGGVVSGQVTAAGGGPGAGRVISVLDRAVHAAGTVPVFDRTVTQMDGSYAFAGLDASFSAGPRQYLVLCLEDAAGYPSLLHDKVTPV